MACLKCSRYIRRVNYDLSVVGVTRNYSQTAVEAVGRKVSYPPIFDATTPEALLRQKRQEFYDHIRALRTVEEKQYAIAASRNRRSKLFLLSSPAETHNGPPFQQYITRTHLIRGLPQQYQATNVDSTFSVLQPHFQRLIASHLSDQWRTGAEFGERAVYELVSLMYRMLSSKHDYLLHSALDLKPRITGYWWHAGFPSEKDRLDEKNICFQYRGHPDFILRTKAPLAPIVPLDDSLCSSPDVPDYNYHPACFGIPFRIRTYVASVPGFWPGDCYEYPFVSFHLNKTLSERKAKLDHIKTSMFPSIEDGFGIMSSFGWLLSTAMNEGFTPFHDVTYPLVAQTVLTDGQDWHFFVYQLNTICFHSDVDLKNKRNICWASGKMRLFEAVENGELKGVNDDVFKVLLRFFLNSPQVPVDVKLKPYLSFSTKDSESFIKMKAELLKMFSNRFDPKAYKYEVPLWQHIYKWHRDAPASPQLKLK